MEDGDDGAHMESVANHVVEENKPDWENVMHQYLAQEEKIASEYHPKQDNVIQIAAAKIFGHQENVRSKRKNAKRTKMWRKTVGKHANFVLLET